MSTMIFFYTHNVAGEGVPATFQVYLCLYDTAGSLHYDSTCYTHR